MQYPLTKHQREVLNTIDRIINGKGYSPTLTELAKIHKVKIPTMQVLVKILIQKGYVARNKKYGQLMLL